MWAPHKCTACIYGIHRLEGLSVLCLGCKPLFTLSEAILREYSLPKIVVAPGKYKCMSRLAVDKE